MDSLKGVAFVVWISSGEGGIDPSRTGMSLTEPHLPRGAESLQPELDRCLQQLHPGPH